MDTTVTGEAAMNVSRGWKRNSVLLSCFFVVAASAGGATPDAPPASASPSSSQTQAQALTTTSATGSVAPLSPADCAAMQQGHVITAANPLPCSRLARVRFSYVDFDGQQHEDGELILMDAVAPYALRLMDQLLAANFPLHGAHPLQDYAGDDEASMADNNTSAFNGRGKTGGKSWSKHAYGAAIDINPLQNPYLSRGPDGKLSVLPPASAPAFIDRSKVRPGMAETATVRALFADNGFLIWGGSWHAPIDYQHFEIGEQGFITRLAQATPIEAGLLFDAYVADYRRCLKTSSRSPANPDQQTRQLLCTQKTMRAVRGQ